MMDNGLDYSELTIPERWEYTMRYCQDNNKYVSGELNDCFAFEGILLNDHEALSNASACAELFLKIKSTSPQFGDTKDSLCVIIHLYGTVYYQKKSCNAWPCYYLHFMQLTTLISFKVSYCANRVDETSSTRVNFSLLP